MTNTFTKISIAIAFVAIVFGAFSFFANTNLIINEAAAQTSCGNCGGGSTPSGGNGGNGGGGYVPPATPTCTITVNKSVVNYGETYTLSWSGTPTNALFYINGQRVAPNDSANYTFDSENYERFVMRGDNGGQTCEAEVRVTKRVVEAPKCDSFTATPTTLPTGGGNVTLTWNTSNATNATLNGQSVAGDGSLVVNNVTSNRSFTLNLSNSAGQASCSVAVTVPTPKPLPTCVISANPTSITSGGQSTLTWSSTNALNATINQGIGSVATAGNRAVNPSQTTTYTMTVSNESGSASCATTVTVVPPAPQAPICDSFTGAPHTINRGQSTTLTWNTTNASSVVINQGIGAVAVDGSTTVSPSDTTTYTLTATGANNQQVTCTKTITVVQPESPKAPICDSFTGTPSTINRGQSATLTWNTTNANTVVINQGIGSVAVDGSVNVSPLETITYTLTATGANNQQVTCTKTITVVQPESPKAPICDSFTSSASSITRGDSVSLSWNTTNVNNVVINPSVGSVAVDGSTTVSPSDTTTYTLTGTGDNNQTVSCTRTVTVTTGGGGGGGGGSSSPRCTLKISDNKISRGDRITITWDTSRATEVTIKDNHGKTIVTTDGKKSDDKKDLYDGSITLRPEKDTTYTLLAERGSKDRTCKVSVDVKDGVTVLESRDQQPVVTGISLTQVPYTGFEAGPFLTMVFYGLLVLWALYLAYVIVMRRQGVVSPVVATATPVTPAPAVVVPTITETPRFVAPTAPTAPTAPVGYASTIPRDEAYDAVATEVENIAHAARVLISSEAMRQFVDATTAENRTTTATAIIEKAKASYPSEDGWVVVNLDRMNSLCALCLTATTPAISVFTPASVAATAGNGSLAEAIVTGNIVAAYQMIGARPMVSLAEAAAELDVLYRMKQGNTVTLSALMATEGARFTPEQVKAAIDALTSALDGVYTNEGEAVKMAILKAIKALA